MQFESLPLFAVFAISCAYFRWLLGSWLTPPAFCALYWTVVIGLNLFFPEYQLLTGGLVYILAVMWAFVIGHAVTGHIAPMGDGSLRRQFHVGTAISSKIFRIGLVIQISTSLFYVTILRTAGVVNIDNISILVQFLLVGHYIGPLAAGLLLGCRALGRVDRWLSVLVLVPGLVISVIYTGRTAFFGPLILFLTSYVAGSVVIAPRQTALFSVRRAVFVVGLFFASSLYGTAIYVLRVARGDTEFATLGEKFTEFAMSFNAESWSNSYEKIRSHLYGQPSSFCFMFRDFFIQPTFQPVYGRFMFEGPARLLWGAERVTHENYVTSDNVETNVYTIFASPIEDFGVWGSAVWWLGLGLFSGYVYRLTQAGSIAGAACVAILLTNLEIGSSFQFRYNSVTCAYIMVVVIGWLIDRQHSFKRMPVAPPVVIPPDRHEPLPQAPLFPTERRT